MNKFVTVNERRTETAHGIFNTNDSLFNPEYGEERMLEHFKVLDNGDFYMIVDNYEHSKTAAYIYKQAESLGF